MKQADGITADVGKGKPGRPFLWIILACAVAHLWCLGSQFYMDDFPAILNNPNISGIGVPSISQLSWTHLGYSVIYKIFGFSPVAYHALNWILHTSVACVLFAFGRDFLRGKWPQGVALFAALLFAVHPLASEIPNYARTQDLAWATLFSLLAGWFLLKFLRDEGWKMWVACGLCVLGATLSKGPGFFHAAMVCGAVGLAFMGEGGRKLSRGQLKWIAGAVVVTLSALWLAGRLTAWFDYTAKWAEPRFIGHAYTLSRVFWEFAWRAVIPVALCSDHEITETLIPPGTNFWNIPDKGAMLAMACFLALTGLSVFLAWRKPTRLFGVCLFLFAATILFRFMYLIPEFMPEYRIYPGMPWFCLGAAIGLTALWRWMFETLSPLMPAVILLGGFAFLSAKRSFVWHDVHRLTQDVLDRYPARARAVWEMDDRDAEAEHWQAIINRQRDVWPEVERQFVTRNQKLAPVREIPSGDFVLAMVGIFGKYARAVAHVQSPVAGLRIMASLEAHMKQMRMDPKTKPVEWNRFYHDKALILESAGQFQAALNCLHQPELMPEIWHKDVERLEKKLTPLK